MTMVGREVERLYAAITYRRVQRYAGTHPQMEDIVGLANLEVWTMLARLPPEERPKAHNLVATAAHHAVVHFLRSPQNEYRRATWSGAPMPQKLSYEEGCARGWFAPRVPDFAPRLVERLWRRHVWRRVWARASDEDRLILRLYFLEGVGHPEIGRRLGHGNNWSYWRVKKLFAPYRAER